MSVPVTKPLAASDARNTVVPSNRIWPLVAIPTRIESNL